MMMNKLVVLVVALAIAAPALADDLIPPWWADDGYGGRVMPTGQDPCDPFRYTGPEQLQGSTYSAWTYDDPCNVFGPYGPGGAPEGDYPDTSWFVSHPDKEDPWHEVGGEQFSGQYWAENEDPCAPLWYESIAGRTGVVDFYAGSWDLNNFIHTQPAKDIQLQLTYLTQSGNPATWSFGAGYGGMEWVEGDPCAVPMGEYEGPLSTFDPCMPVLETWLDGTEAWGWMEEELSAWDPCWVDPLYTWDNSEPHEEWFEEFIDGTLANQMTLGDGWIHEVWTVSFPLNPEFEWVEGGWAEEGGVLLDQAVIDTLCYVPEPATMVLLGLGSLLMIRRKR